jgi:hypothetical protein
MPRRMAGSDAFAPAKALRLEQVLAVTARRR